MSDGQQALQRAVFAHLGADADLTALIAGRIHDQAPEDAIFPFLTLGEARTTAHPAGKGDAMEHRLSLHAWSRWGGRMEAKAVMNAVHAALHDATLDLSADGHRLVQIRFVFGDVFPRRDGDIYQGLMRYRAVTEPLPA